MYLPLWQLAFEFVSTSSAAQVMHVAIFGTQCSTYS